MRYSKLFSKTSKNAAHDADSANARFLEQGGFIHREVAGVYSYLPLGLRVLRKINQIIRDEMDAIDGQEVLMPALTPKENWVRTGRWETLDILFQLKGAGDKDYALGASHEEIVTPLMQDYAFSYKDLPASVYQIQNKFRNELRAKSGILRGREFGMKDMYSFHTDEKDLDKYYEKDVIPAYFKIFKRIGFDPKVTYLTYASGGAFSKFSHEFQVLTDVGEDTIFACEKCRTAVNREVLDVQKDCPKCDSKDLVEKKSVEVGNIFKLGTRFSDSFNFKFSDKDGNLHAPWMGCYGIGPTRVMGTVVEVFNDEGGIIWPKSIAPFQVNLVSLPGGEKEAEKLYKDLQEAGIEVLFDDRDERAGAKFKDSDLIGIPLRLVVSARTLENKAVEWKERNKEKADEVKLNEVLKKVEAFYK